MRHPKAIILGDNFFMECIAGILKRSSGFDEVLLRPRLDDSLINGCIPCYLFMHSEFYGEKVSTEIRRIVTSYPWVTVILYAGADVDIKQLMKAGVRAILSEKSNPRDLTEAIAKTELGKLYLCPVITDLMIKESFRSDKTIPFTTKQKRLLNQLAAGNSLDHIARERPFKQPNLYRYLDQIMKKAGVTSLDALIRFAMEQQ